MSSINAVHRYSRLFFVLTALALGGCDDHDPVVTQDTGVVRQVYQQLAQDWVQWAMGLPWSTGPVTGARCAVRDGPA